MLYEEYCVCMCVCVCVRVCVYMCEWLYLYVCSYVSGVTVIVRVHPMLLSMQYMCGVHIYI